MKDSPAGLLEPDEPEACMVERIAGSSPFFLICDHAGARIPRRLGTLGLTDADLRRHIAWDIGIAAVASMMSEMLDATLVMQPYSRLVIDCNRPPRSPDSIATVSERTAIPGNANLTDADSRLRENEIFVPYHECIRRELDARLLRGRPSLLLAMHSFTPVYLGTTRPWHVGLLHNRDARLARALGTALQAEPGLVVGDNEPYSVSDETDYAIPVHGERRDLPHVEIEIRQDLITDEAGQRQWALRLARLLRPIASLFAT